MTTPTIETLIQRSCLGALCAIFYGRDKLVGMLQCYRQHIQQSERGKSPVVVESHICSKSKHKVDHLPSNHHNECLNLNKAHMFTLCEQ